MIKQSLKSDGEPGRGPLTAVPTVLVHLGAGVGNVVLATTLLVVLREMGFAVDVWLTADYPQTTDLLRPWNAVREVFTSAVNVPAFGRYTHVLPAIPPFYWPRFAIHFKGLVNVVARPSQALFYENEQAYYLSFARALGRPFRSNQFCTLPISQNEFFGVSQQTLVLAPGCKTGDMAAKRWPYFPELAEVFRDVAVVGTADDLCRNDGSRFEFPSHVQSFVDRLSLRQTAEVLASAGVVVANDSGLAHVAAALGVPTIILFGPTPDRTLGILPPNVTVLRRGLPCEPCWFKARFKACSRRISCLDELSVQTVLEGIEHQGFVASPRMQPGRNVGCLQASRGPAVSMQPPSA